MTTEATKSIDEVKAEVLKFLQEETGFGQVYTINKDGSRSAGPWAPPLRTTGRSI